MGELCQHFKIKFLQRGCVIRMLEISNLTKKFGKFTALNEVNLNVGKEKFLALLARMVQGKQQRFASY